MDNDNLKNIDIYLKITEYKRSIGTTQWTVMSIFVTASEVVLAFSIQQLEFTTALSVRIFGLLIYWFGFSLFIRYRALNEQVSNYLLQLEKENGLNFQAYLNDTFHKKGIATKWILLLFGVIYSGFALLISLI